MHAYSQIGLAWVTTGGCGLHKTFLFGVPSPRDQAWQWHQPSPRSSGWRPVCVWAAVGWMGNGNILEAWVRTRSEGEAGWEGGGGFVTRAEAAWMIIRGCVDALRCNG